MTNVAKSTNFIFLRYIEQQFTTYTDHYPCLNQTKINGCQLDHDVLTPYIIYEQLNNNDILT